MKDSEVEFEEWWEVIKEYFTKELENNMAQHKANERIQRYKLEAYQKNFLDFIVAIYKYRGIKPRWRERSRA
jgi:hypothetical protein